jgi:uncharacterized protein (UPF0332 family)
MDASYSREAFAAKLGANGDPKLNAAADFAARLLNSSIGDRVARIVLFGSVAGGVARPNSDVDVMIFAGVPPKVLSEATAEAAWDATVEWAELVSPLTYPRGRLFQPRPYVVYNALKRGREIYAMEEEEVRYQEALGLYKKARQHLDDAHAMIGQAIFTFAIVGAYTAAELAAKALVILKPGVELPYTHGGLVQIFSREDVKTGEAPREWSRLLEVKLQLRTRALYEPDVTPEKEDAQSVIDLAQEMLDFLQRKLDETGGSQP